MKDVSDRMMTGKSTIQYAPDRLSLQAKANVRDPPITGGPYRPDCAYDEDTEQMSWGPAHRAWKTRAYIIRFDC
jgi:hypothetical protein